MRILAFHANDGDCLLLSTSTPVAGGPDVEHHILIDGGRSTAFRENARDTVYALDRLDVVCVSHIDEDHIAGVVTLVEDMVEWRVHRFELGSDPDSPPPSFPEPPDIGEIWHNSLFDLVGDDIEPRVQPAMTTSAGVLSGSGDPAVSDLGLRLASLAAGERSAMELSRRISARQLGIQRNRPKDELMKRRSPRSFRRVGPMTIRILGPSDEDVEALREDWSDWIDDNGKALAKLQEEMLDDEERLGSLEAKVVAQPMIGAALGDGVAGVSEPNVASLMLLVQESGGSRVLLTGDGISSRILDGLAHYRKLDANGRIHVEVLKVQHHGAAGNVTEEFVAAVSADNYLFCGCGASGNPEIEVVEALALARLTGRNGLPPIEPGRPFKFWFTSSGATTTISTTRRQHMAAVESLVAQIKTDHDPNGLFTFEFLDAGHFTINV